MQTYTSANTSINSVKLPMVYNDKRVINLITNKKVIDIGGGKFDNAIEYCKGLNTELSIYDKYNRTEEHNATVLSKHYNVAIISNVLNVIDSYEERQNVIKLADKLADKIVITVYEGDKSGIGRPTKADCWQENRKTEDYMAEIAEVLNRNVKRYGKVIIS